VNRWYVVCGMSLRVTNDGLLELNSPPFQGRAIRQAPDGVVF